MFRFCLPVLLILQLVLTCPGWSQPLVKAIETDDGYGYFLEADTLYQLTPEGRLTSFDRSFESPTLSQPDDWGDGFLIQAKEEILRATSSNGKLEFQTELKGQGLELTVWGSKALVRQDSGKPLTILTRERQTALEGTVAESGSVAVVSPDLALFRSGDNFYRLQGKKAELLKLPFPGKDAELVVAQDRVYFSHPESDKLFEATEGASISLPARALHGLRVLPGGEPLVGCSGYLFLIEHTGLNRILPEPKEIARDNFKSATAFIEGRRFHYLNLARGFPELIVYHSDGRIASQNFPPDLKLRASVVPSADQGGYPMLFFDTSMEEPKVDDDGRPVLELESGEPDQMKISGHQLYVFSNAETWNVVHTLPRTRVIGPVERVGDKVVYATQTLPPNVPGQSREVNHRYPYPQVILQGLSSRNPSDRWALEVPRGQSPSKPRLPEKAWPLLGESGPLILTSEEGRLLSVAPESGEVQWSSPELGLDESSPRMLSWPGKLGLIASSATTKTLLLIDPESGKLTSSPSITPTLDRSKLWHMLGVAVLCLALAYYIYVAGKRELYIRKIAGLQALDEAVGRATEMGKPVLYVTGLADVDDIQTLAALSILSHVARKTAEYDTPIVATTSRAVTYSAAQEVVRDAFTIAGRPDAFSVESVRYISDDQFGYTAGVDGIMLREKPAANFYMGKFYAESLILAETGHATGAIQIAGTAQPSQLPFFVAACDYTLIGEELFAASAYLSKDPLQVGSLRGQDVGKALVMAFLVLGSLYVTVVQIMGAGTP